MRHKQESPADASWSAVYALLERWAELPAASWHALLAAEALAADDGPVAQPDEMERWLIRDLVETAWALADRHGEFAAAEWTTPARVALEHVAWRVLDPRRPARGALDVYLRRRSEPRDR